MRMHLATAIAMFAACGPATGAGEPGAAKETHVIDVKTSDDLVAARAEYMRLWDAGFDGTLEIRIAPGAYTPVSWSLEPAPDSPRRDASPTIDVVLRGGPAAPPPPEAIHARNLRIEDLILTRTSAPWRLVVSESVALRRTVLVDCRARERSDGTPLLAILGRGEAGAAAPRAVTARIEKSWFLRNQQSVEASAMIGFGSVEALPSYWDSILIDDSAFLGDAFATELDIRFARAVRISNSVFYKTWPDGVLIQSTSSGEVTLEGSTVVVEDAAHVARNGAESPPVAFAGTTRVWTRTRDRQAVERADAAVKDALALAAGQMPPDDLKRRLDAALR
ncbi:MAG TPA: hypothetical protein VMZ28_18205 [Kofleriaceae bacterium]|nr:hypothetical protein [Kofleriaceae bacterium]